jgi:transcriptional regulator with XRE-family HTH domain
MLQQQRQHHGLTQFELAERANLSLKYLGEVERGEANVTVDALERIAEALEWDPWELFNTDRTPISESVHTLLVGELTSARQRMAMVIEWLTALDPLGRTKAPPLESLPADVRFESETPRASVLAPVPPPAPPPHKKRRIIQTTPAARPPQPQPRPQPGPLPPDPSKRQRG